MNLKDLGEGLLNRKYLYDEACFMDSGQDQLGHERGTPQQLIGVLMISGE